MRIQCPIDSDYLFTHFTPSRPFRNQLITMPSGLWARIQLTCNETNTTQKSTSRLHVSRDALYMTRGPESTLCIHDDVIQWKHFTRGEFTGHRRIPHTKASNARGALMFSLIWTWMNRWINNCEAGDLRRYRAHYDVIAMFSTTALVLKTFNTNMLCQT